MKQEIKLIIIFNVVYTIFTIKRLVLQLHVGPMLRLFTDFSSSGKQFQIRGPKDLRLIVPKVT